MRIAFIGTGVMGRSMAGHLLAAGHELVVHSRTKSKAQPLLERGAAWADSPAQAANGADFAISIVGFPEDVEQVHLCGGGTLAARQPPKLIIDMTTSRPSLAVAIHEQAAQRGVGSLDAPVSGGDIGAREATLSIMVGGGPPHIEQAMPVLQIMGRNIVHQGGPGAGQHAKMVNQILIVANMVGVCEGLLYAQAAGLDPETLLRSVSAGAAGSWSVSNLAPRIVRGDFEPGFYIEHFIKDLGIALEEAQRMKLNLPGLVLAKQLYEQAQAQGLSRKGTQALMLVYEQMNETARATAGPRRGAG